jgi:hypothetical protein
MALFDRSACSAAATALTISAAALFVAPTRAQVAIGVSISAPIAPPALPAYLQPPIPEPGHMWTPGYWAWNGTGYYWVPGTWVTPPRVGLLWTPSYWAWSNGAYVFHAGYWGSTVGYYGGINYGFGYTGIGFAGGYWTNGVFDYNTAVTNPGAANIVNTYNAPITINKTPDVTSNINSTIANNVSYNRGPGGTTAAATPEQQAYAANQAQQVPPTPAQVQHQQAAATNKAQCYVHNKGAPPIAATARPGDFQGAVTRASAPPSNAPSAHIASSAPLYTQANKPKALNARDSKPLNVQANKSGPAPLHHDGLYGHTSHLQNVRNAATRPHLAVAAASRSSRIASSISRNNAFHHARDNEGAGFEQRALGSFYDDEDDDPFW